MYSRDTAIQARYGGDIRTAAEWAAFIAGGRSKTERPAANNTTVRMNEQGGAVIRLHQTDIVIIGTSGQARLNSGGWLSMTTKERINRYTRAGITQKNGIWYMRDGSLFYDDMVIDAAGYPVHPRHPEKYEKKLKAIKKQARAYAKDFVAAIQRGEVGLPSGGDCWGCYFQLGHANDPKKRPFGTDHIQQHITDKYYVPSLLVNAGRAAGYRDDQIGLMGIGGHRLFVDPENVIYKYVVRLLQEAL